MLHVLFPPLLLARCLVLPWLLPCFLELVFPLGYHLVVSDVEDATTSLLLDLERGLS
jgi:hypothetical protein